MRKIASALKTSATDRLFKMLFMVGLVAISVFTTACSEDKSNDVEKTYVEGVSITSNKTEVCNGSEQMLTVTFSTDDGYTLDTDNAAMVNFFDGGSSSAAGNHQARIQLRQNDSGAERTAIIYITVKGHNRTQLMSITQKAGSSDEVVIWVDERLQNEYYWLDEYNEKHTSFDFTLTYDKFLSQSLLSLTTNTMDGGVDSKGNRYLYSYIQLISGSNSSSSASTRASSVSGYGLMLSSGLWQISDAGALGFAVEHIYPGSSAAQANIHRGDVIVKIQGMDITDSNVNELWNKLQLGALGATVSISVLAEDDTIKNIDLALGSYAENPVAYHGVLELPEEVANSGKKIGYLSYLAFDAAFDSELIAALQSLKSEGITDLILDLRHNHGGSVNSSIILASSILGSAHEGKLYATLERNPKNKNGNSTCKIVTSNGSTALPSLDMSALWVITTPDTASASEMIISGLRGLDIPVTLVGIKTEGKNCGMDVMEKTIGSAKYSYAPITFINLNAKGFYEYADGFEADIDIPSYASKTSNESIQYFSQAYPMPFASWGVVNKDLALMEAVMNIHGKSVLDESNEGEARGAMKPQRELNVAKSATRAGEPMKLERDRKVFGMTLTEQERKSLSDVE